MSKQRNKGKYLGKRSTQELINLTKSALMKKQNQMQFDLMPDPAMLLGKVIEYVGVTTSRFIKGHLYRSTGTMWHEVYPGAGGEGGWFFTSALPPAEEAVHGQIYFTEDEEGVMHGYILGDDEEWLEVTTSTPAAISDEEIEEIMESIHEEDIHV